MPKKKLVEGGQPVITKPSLYAVVPRTPKERTKLPRRSLSDIRQAKHAEFEVKSSIDQADRVLSKLEARAAAFGKQIALLQRRKQIALARAQRIEERILAELEKAKLAAADGWHARLTVKPCPAAVTVDNEALIPMSYLRETITTSPDKHLIRETLERGFRVIDAEALPDEFLTVSGPNMAALRAAFDRNASVPGTEKIAAIPGCRLTQRMSLQRK